MDIVLYTLILLLISLIFFGWFENTMHIRALGNIPLRIHINGSRGKSSVTRLVASGLRSGGLKVLAKTTGSAPRIIDENGKDLVIHRLRTPSIGEQVKLLRYFAKKKPDAVVMECMAVDPQYQWIAEHKMVQSHIGVITNVRPDHLEEMGPSMKDITFSLSNSIPNNGQFLTVQSPFNKHLRHISNERNTTFYEVDTDEVTPEYLSKFPFLEHDENVALALKVCELAGVEKKTAKEGMLNTSPDPGALVLWELEFGDHHNKFVSAFAANDPESTLKIWNLVQERLTKQSVCVFLNTRSDRRQRTEQLVSLVNKHIKPDIFIVRGEDFQPSVNQEIKSMDVKISIHPLNSSPSDLIDELKTLDHTFIFGIGNIVGWGESFVSELKQFRING
jgi:poly-gamma-glutamate synthase PgsB/CapB